MIGATVRGLFAASANVSMKQRRHFLRLKAVASNAAKELCDNPYAIVLSRATFHLTHSCRAHSHQAFTRGGLNLYLRQAFSLRSLSCRCRQLHRLHNRYLRHTLTATSRASRYCSVRHGIPFREAPCAGEQGYKSFYN